MVRVYVAVQRRLASFPARGGPFEYPTGHRTGIRSKLKGLTCTIWEGRFGQARLRFTAEEHGDFLKRVSDAEEEYFLSLVSCSSRTMEGRVLISNRERPLYMIPRSS